MFSVLSSLVGWFVNGWPTFVKWLRKLWPLILGLAIGVFIVYRSYSLGFDVGKQKQYLEQQALVMDYQAKAIESERVYSAMLEEARNEAKRLEAFNQAQSISLAKSNQERAQFAAQIRKDVSHAVNQDAQGVVGSCVGGLGSSSLQLYKRALGYAD